MILIYDLYDAKVRCKLYSTKRKTSRKKQKP